MVLIARKIQNHQSDQREGDGYFNATAMCRAVGQKFGHYCAVNVRRVRAIA